MTSLSQDLRKRIVQHYKTEITATYLSTSAHFSVGVATVNRLLRLQRETGDVVDRPRTLKRKFKMNLDWLRADVAAHPDDRLKDRAERYKSECNIVVNLSSIWDALQALKITHKKKRSTL
jgi:transposase